MNRPKTYLRVREHSIFYVLLLLTLLSGFIYFFQSDKGALLLYFSAHRSPFWNFMFKYGTQLAEPIAFIGIAVIMLGFRYRHAIGVPTLGIFVTIISYLTKQWFKMPRPRQYFMDLGMIDQITVVQGVKMHGGSNSFPSGHTMAGFALFIFLTLCSRKGWTFDLLFFALALLVGLSRIYLGQHFLEDVLSGALIGTFLGTIWYHWHMQWGRGFPHRWLDGRYSFKKNRA